MQSRVIVNLDSRPHHRQEPMALCCLPDSSGDALLVGLYDGTVIFAPLGIPHAACRHHRGRSSGHGHGHGLSVHSESCGACLAAVGTAAGQIIIYVRAAESVIPVSRESVEQYARRDIGGRGQQS